ncbi:hypothetical protein K525DRAFT_275572, partial [Schizophyllum commune Loenen D]
FFGGSPFGTREGPFAPRGGSFFADPFANDPFFSRRTRGFTFTDPFELFDAFFGVPHERERGPWRVDPFSGFGGRQDPFGAFGGLFGGMGSSMLALPSALGTGSGSGSRSYSMMSSGFGSSSGGGWTSESVSTTTVNGVTTTVREKRDAQGNVHRTKIYPDGREVYTINGIEQKKIDSGENKRKALENGSSSRKRGNGGGERGSGEGALPPPARGDSMESSSSSEPYSSRPSSPSHHRITRTARRPITGIRELPGITIYPTRDRVLYAHPTRTRRADDVHTTRTHFHLQDSSANGVNGIGQCLPSPFPPSPLLSLPPSLPYPLTLPLAPTPFAIPSPPLPLPFAYPFAPLSTTPYRPLTPSPPLRIPTSLSQLPN